MLRLSSSRACRAAAWTAQSGRRAVGTRGAAVSLQPARHGILCTYAGEFANFFFGDLRLGF